MNLKLIDMTIDGYKDLPEEDRARLAFFRKLWGVIDGIEPKAAEYKAASKGALQKLGRQEIAFLDDNPYPIDVDALVRCCEKLSEAVVEEGVYTKAINDYLSNLDWKKLIGESNVRLAGKDPTVYLDSILVELVGKRSVNEVAAQMATALLKMALRRQLEPVAKELMGVLDEEFLRNFHPIHCPVCGSEAALARVGGKSLSQGRGKVLGCLQCGNEWDFDRVRCPRCGSQNQGHLHYFNVDGDDAHRIGTCDDCGQYTRTVFYQDNLAPSSIDVEDVVMAKLDAIANDPRFRQE